MINSKKIASKIMLILICSVLLSAFGVSSVNATQDSWTSHEPMQQARSRLGVAVVNGKIYAIGGDKGDAYGYPADFIYAGTGKTVGTNEEYDVVTGTWSFKASMPTPRYNFGIAVHQNKIYCIGGYSNGSFTGVNEVYDPITDTWETKERMPTPRGYLATNTVNGKIYAIGGASEKTNEVYDPATDSWATKTPLPNEVYHCSSAVINNKIYVMDGRNTQIYSPETDSWSVAEHSPTYSHSSVATSTTGVFAPKRIHLLNNNAHYVYDPENNSWTNSTLMPTPRGYVGIATINDTLYTVGGVKLPKANILIGAMTTSSVNEQYTPTNYIPEFSSWTFLGAGLFTVMAVSIIYRRGFKVCKKKCSVSKQ